MTKKLSEKEITLQTYNKSAKKLAEYFSGVSGPRKAFIDKSFKIYSKNNPKVLEIGCGDGRDAEYIVSKTKNYEGFDLSERMIELARKRLKGVNFFVDDLSQYNCHKKYDIIFALSALVHSDKKEVKDFIYSMSSCLVENGILVIDLKIKKTYTRELQTDKFGMRVFYYYTPELIQNFVRNKYKTLFMETQTIGKTEWLTIILQKTKN